MSKSLTVHMLVELPTPLGPSLIFHRWLPREGECLSVQRGHFDFHLWWELDCLAHASKIREDDIPHHINLMVHKVHVEIKIPGVSSELVEYIHNRGRNKNYDGQPELRKEFVSLAVDIYRTTVEVLNRFISAVRINRGQYWAIPLGLDEDNAKSFFIGSFAKVSTTDFAAVCWNPPLDYCLKLEVGSSDRHITRDDWEQIQDFLKQSSAPPLVRELITYAEQLCKEGHFRASLIQGVSALELAINRFLENPDLQQLKGNVIRDDIEFRKLTRIKDKLGLRGSLSLLLPLLLTKTQLPPKVLSSCKSAVEIRGTIVHAGQRDLDEKKLRGFLQGIREMVYLLEAVAIAE